jgi:hypothetical protein
VTPGKSASDVSTLDEVAAMQLVLKGIVPKSQEALELLIKRTHPGF